MLNFIFGILIILFDKMVAKFFGRKVSCVVRLNILGKGDISAWKRFTIRHHLAYLGAR